MIAAPRRRRYVMWDEGRTLLHRNERGVSQPDAGPITPRFALTWRSRKGGASRSNKRRVQHRAGHLRDAAGRARRHKRAKGVMRIRNFLTRFSGETRAVVRACCHDRARLGCSRGALFFGALPLAASRTNARRSAMRVGPRRRKRREFFDNLTRTHATGCNPVQPGATWCDRNHGCAKRTQFTSETSTVRGFPRCPNNVPECAQMCRNVPSRQMCKTNPFRAARIASVAQAGT